VKAGADVGVKSGADVGVKSGADVGVKAGAGVGVTVGAGVGGVVAIVGNRFTGWSAAPNTDLRGVNLSFLPTHGQFCESV
jgi:hypothetical protein